MITTAAVLTIGYQKSNFGENQEVFVRWIGFSLLAFMAPTILAYGRIMGASWNTLIINKWRTMKGISTAIDPELPSYIKRFFSLVIVLFLATMPLAAINGIVTLVYVELENPADANSMLDLGGIVGWLQNLVTCDSWLSLMSMKEAGGQMTASMWCIVLGIGFYVYQSIVHWNWVDVGVYSVTASLLGFGVALMFAAKAEMQE